MAPEERSARMQRMRALVRENNVYRWAGSLIGELAGIRLVQTHNGARAARVELVSEMAPVELVESHTSG
jgi:trehalose-6-phosphate synthase